MSYRFLRKDYDALLAKIDELEGEVRAAGDELAEWVEQGSEVDHDNFGYEEGQRQQIVSAGRRGEFVEMKEAAEIVDGLATGEVDIGARVTIEDTKTGERRTLVIGSYQVLAPESEEEVSYAAPLAQPLLGAVEGEEREVAIAGERTTYRIVAIQ